MYSRVTLLEIDTVRIGVDDAIKVFTTEVLPRLEAQEGFEGVLVLSTPEGKGMIVSLWRTEQEAASAAGFASGLLEEYVALFAAPPGREYYEVSVAELPAARRS